jgi:hypothetical protein
VKMEVNKGIARHLRGVLNAKISLANLPSISA